MAQQTINIGTVANDGTGDPLRTAFDKSNDNFTELYGGAGVADGSITPAKLGVSYKNLQSIGTAGTTETLDFSLYNTFDMTNDTTLTLSFSNIAAGDVKNILITAGATGTSTLTFDTSYGGARLVSGEYDPTDAAVNFIQVVMVAASTAYISISQTEVI